MPLNLGFPLISQVPYGGYLVFSLAEVNVVPLVFLPDPAVVAFFFFQPDLAGQSISIFKNLEKEEWPRYIFTHP